MTARLERYILGADPSKDRGSRHRGADEGEVFEIKAHELRFTFLEDG